MLPLAGLALVLAGCGTEKAANSAPDPRSVSTLAGNGPSGAVDGIASAALFNNPVNVLAAPDGSLYIADFNNGRIRRMSAVGVVTTLVNIPTFQRPFGMALGPAGVLYVQTDADDTGAPGPTNGTIWSVNTTTGVPTKIVGPIGRPRGLGVLSTGDLILSDVARHTIRRLNPATGVITDIAGQADTPGFADATGAAARFNRPYGVAVLPDDSILVADQNNHRIRKVTLAGVVTTIAGSGTSGALDGARAVAQFNNPQDVAVRGDRIYIADTGGHTVRLLVGEFVTTFAGSGVRGYAEGIGLAARFYGLEGIDIDKDGRVIVADGTGGDEGDPPYNRIRVIAP
jgi:streptogramin lyase